MSYKACACALLMALSSSAMSGVPEADELSAPMTCATSPEFSEQSVILVLDRTTILSPGDKSGWKQAVNSIFENPSIGGSVRVAEIRDNDVTFTISPPLCLRTLSAPHTARSALESGEARILLDKISNWLGLDKQQPDPNEVDDDVEIQAAQLRLEQRSALEQHVKAVVDADHPTYPTSIVVPFFKLLQTGCAGRKICRIYIFSDLLDTKVRRELKVGSAGAVILARQTYRQNLQIYELQLQTTRLHIVSWGLGRDDADSQKPLTPPEMLSLTIFWSTLFDQVCAMSAKGSSVTLTSLFVTVEYPGCNSFAVNSPTASPTRPAPKTRLSVALNVFGNFPVRKPRQ